MKTPPLNNTALQRSLLYDILHLSHHYQENIEFDMGVIEVMSRVFQLINSCVFNMHVISMPKNIHIFVWYMYVDLE